MTNFDVDYILTFSPSVVADTQVGFALGVYRYNAQAQQNSQHLPMVTYYAVYVVAREQKQY